MVFPYSGERLIRKGLIVVSIALGSFPTVCGFGLCSGSFLLGHETGHSIARPIAALRQQGPTPADGPRRNSPRAGQDSSCFPSRAAGSFPKQVSGGGAPARQRWGGGGTHCNNSDRRQWRMQGAVVGAAASKTQASARGCWVPQPDITCAGKLPDALQEQAYL